jgi:hypothetical protein
MILALTAIVGLATLVKSSSFPCHFPDIATCESLDGDDCSIGFVQGAKTYGNCRQALVYSCYGRDTRCPLVDGQCNVWSAFTVQVCDVYCERTSGLRVYLGWCGESVNQSSGITLNTKCNGGPCDPSQAADPIPNLVPPIPPNPPNSFGLDWPQVINFFENPGGGGD